MLSKNCQFSCSKLGMKAQDTSELFFEDIRLPMSSIIGGEKGLNKGFMMLMSELPQERLLIGAMSMASCEFLYETTRDYGTFAASMLLLIFLQRPRSMEE